ncbi:hypothetical protein CALVIDRAFT_380343 [Calocera viscosa TUFC12733]|uniref:Transcription factor domain-containing protein n=1 Tax=Calocera viscosa (strain TUFC12733) TaxID=1330018 RepID=A0A167Q4U4_CALVF|nr:hypothetical protein CALVIDRAFT_380343 [Calocera viscosa TUFC12733]
MTARPLTTDSVDARLSLGEIVSTLSSHLIEEYFCSAQYRLPLYRWQNFRELFERAGRRPEQMAGMGGVIAHTLIAYGAYASNSPAILGPGAAAHSNIDSEEGNFIHWGQQRAAVCGKITDLAVRIADERGVFRVECNESILILLLLEMLLDHGDASGRRGRPFRVAALGHARALYEERSKSNEYPELQGGGLGWHFYTRDTMQAAVAGLKPRLKDRDVQMLCGQERILDLPTPEGIAQALNGEILAWIPVIRIWNHITHMTRQLALRMARDAGSRDDPFDDNFLWKLYQDLDDTTAAIQLMQARLSEFFTSKKPSHNFFQFYCRTNSLGCILVNFLVHRGVKQELQNLHERIDRAYLTPLDDITDFGESEHEQRRSRLLQLKHEADGRMHDCARELASVLWSMQNALPARTGLGIMTGVPMMYETLPTFAEILCTTPSTEEGGSQGFPLATKVQEVGWLLSTYRSLGWSWADMADLIKYLENHHTRLMALKSRLAVLPTHRKWAAHPASRIRPSVKRATSSFAPPTPESMEAAPRPDLFDQPSGDYTSIASTQGAGTVYAAALMPPQALTLRNLQTSEAPDFVSHVLPEPSMMIGTGTSTTSVQVFDPFADMYTMDVENEMLDDGMVQPGGLSSPPSYEDLQQWASLFSDQVPPNWDFGHSGFSPPPH